MLSKSNECSLTDLLLSSTAVSVSNHAALAQFCRDQEIRLVVVGPEVPLAAGKKKQVKNHSLHNLGRKANFSPLRISERGIKVFPYRKFN